MPQREMERERAVTFVGLFPIIDLARYSLRVRQKLGEDPDDHLLWEHSKQQCFPRLLAKRKRGWRWGWGLEVPYSEWKESLATTQKVSFCISGSLKKTSCGHGAVGDH